MFDANKAVDHIVKWIHDWFEQNGKGCNAVIGISGGKDSTVTAALCAKALGKDKVIGVMMPTFIGVDEEIDKTSIKICRHLGISFGFTPIGKPVQFILNSIEAHGFTKGEPSSQTTINLPARIRMAALYAISQSNNGRVANTCNLSEDYVGYATKYGDAAGDFSPLSQYTVTEVRAIGKALGLPDEFVYRVPSDGLCGKTDEDNLGFTYDVLDKYIRTGICEDPAVKEKIDRLHEINKFKLEPMQFCPYVYVCTKG